MTSEALAIARLGLAPDTLAGQVAVVTGAAQGVGRAAARALAWLGARVVVADIAAAGGAETAALVQAAGGEALSVPTDVSSPGDVSRLVRQVRAAYGPVDILVNNAIACSVVPVAEMDVATWDQVMGVNLRGAFLTCRAFLPDMLARRRGTIINMVSTDAMPGLAAYIASKRGLAGFSQSLAAEVGEAGISVIAFAPGFVDTPGLRAAGAALAPRLGFTAEQFYGLSLHPAYRGMMPAGDAGAATAYLAAALARDYHGETVTGYEVLERAGYLPAGTTAAAAAPAGATAAAAAPAGTTAAAAVALAGAARLAGELQAALAETDAEFARLPVFARPLARAGFRSKAGLSLPDWRHTAAVLAGQLAPAVAGGGTGALAAGWPRLRGLLERLAGYYAGVPAETARFTRDQALLQEVRRISEQRVATVRSLVAALDLTIGKVDN